MTRLTGVADPPSLQLARTMRRFPLRQSTSISGPVIDGASTVIPHVSSQFLLRDADLINLCQAAHQLRFRGSVPNTGV